MNDRNLHKVHLRCSAAVFRHDTILLLHRAAGDWVLPGGTPAFGEGTAACTIREVREETGLAVNPLRVAFLLETTNLDYGQHLIEIVFYAETADPQAQPQLCEPGLTPSFVPLDKIGRLPMRPPIAGHLRTLASAPTRGATVYLGNVWRPTPPVAARSEQQPLGPGEQVTGTATVGTTE
jgi:8-oxo-dGTP diphosphatase